ncbi:binding-protein-dependent transport systems inner membrane component [Syntrophobotulus glycolicus DSM 8271]|uniref:Binding-protein-dependent transport systems inner membrane component n=1 Tax=Syntrophobotulus glycolicus (strain DSM 8271 / FlGlyR) TaxID=645991 RepID=F0SYQ3_SYNGF|nr:proline/glycine betaine ABC transporter permease [Syntrophobotulus glycolicus]ADY54854.1 binding-protein-dependent transport systems inner membrane component [Syntrophobotulus glycolicus DSM 8271]
MTKIPIAELVDQGVKDLQYHYGEILDTFAKEINSWIKTLGQLLLLIPWWALIVVFALVAWRAKGWKLAAGTAAGLGLIYNLNLWPAFLDTLILVMISALVSMAVGIPLGILAAKNDKFNWLISPVLDFMQTMPAYVYLIPALLFFGIGKVPAVFATVVFSMPPAIRLTNLGIRQVPVELVEVGEAFGSKPGQLLLKIQLPVALPTIMAGINQTMMLSLSMVVISSMIGAGGLGGGVLEAISQLKIGMGFEYGVAVVIMAIILDRISQGIGRSLRTEDNK